jgi:P pilus assembly chaperone PapD
MLQNKKTQIFAAGEVVDNKYFRQMLLSLGMGLAANLSVLSAVWAQRFTIAPMVTIVETKSGQASGSISIFNQGQEPLKMRVYAESFTYDRLKGFTFVPQDNRSAAPYLQFSPREMEIPPGVTRNIRVAVTLPANLPDQEYRVAVFVEDLKERAINSNNGGNRLLIKARVASVFFFSKGSTTAEVQIRTAAWNAATKKVSILLENQGSKSAYPEIDWRMERNGKEVAKDNIRGVIVQSQNSREIALEPGQKPLDLASGEYDLSGTITIKGQKPTTFKLKLAIP